MKAPRGFRLFGLILPAALAFLLVIPLRDTMPGGAQAAFNHASRLFQQGSLAKSQSEAEQGYRQFQRSSAYWAAEFQLLEAQSMLYRGMYDGALKVLANYRDAAGPEGRAEKLAIEAVALVRQNQVTRAHERLAHADALCRDRDLSTCGDVLSAHGLVAIKSGHLSEARKYFMSALKLARKHNSRWLQVSAALNLGYIAMQADHYDEAVDWLRAANRDAVASGYKNAVQSAAGNLGWAYYQLGDSERALEQFRQAETSAEEIGNVRDQLKWLSTTGYVYQDSGDWARALDAYHGSLVLARQIDSKEDITNALEDLAAISVESGRLVEAVGYIEQVSQIEGTERQSANLHETKCMLAAAQQKYSEAEVCFRAVRSDATALTTLRMDAGYRLAGVYEAEGNAKAAEETYRSTLDRYESARATLKSEETELPFGANASRIYDSYVRLLMQEGRTDEALAIADESRAGTLEKGLDVPDAGAEEVALLNPRLIAQRANATLLFYWLGEKQSYLWAITEKQITWYGLPPRKQIAGRVQSYTKKILALRDLQRSGDRDGEALYQRLIAPATAQIEPGKRVIILADGELSQLNFETLLVPDRNSQSQAAENNGAQVHYLIEDMTLASAPSLSMLNAHEPVRGRGGKMLLLGDPVSPSSEFPSLPLFGYEMSKIETHFSKDELAVFAGQKATPDAYLESKPAQYSYIHFVSHAVPNQIVPLDSAIVLSKDSSDENSFKLYARDIVQHPIDAKLVTISACYTSGTRFYAGEGLVGLSWAFLRAGAQRVIGALWEVSDESTPRLMDGLYRNIEGGDSPADSLRKSKLALLHSQSRFSLPFYWATFQIYEKE